MRSGVDISGTNVLGHQIKPILDKASTRRLSRFGSKRSRVRITSPRPSQTIEIIKECRLELIGYLCREKARKGIKKHVKAGLAGDTNGTFAVPVTSPFATFPNPGRQLPIVILAHQQKNTSKKASRVEGDSKWHESDQSNQNFGATQR